MAKKKQNDIFHPKHRWFIWAIVILAVTGVGLISYIGLSVMKDQAEFDASFNPRSIAPPNY